MPFVELRRHSLRDPPDEELSAAGRSLAESVGRGVGPFGLIVSSPVRRAVETAQAMGYPSPRIDPKWGLAGGDEALKQAWPLSFSAMRELVDRRESTHRLGTSLLRSVEQMLAAVPRVGGILVVTHGGLPEVLTVAALPRSDPRPWGGALRCMEGVRLRFDGTIPRSAEILRVSDELTRI